MQLADVLAGHEAPRDLALKRAGLIAEKTQRLVRVDGENDVVVCLPGTPVCELEDRATFHSRHLLHGGAHVQLMSLRKTALERVHVCF